MSAPTDARSTEAERAKTFGYDCSACGTGAQLTTAKAAAGCPAPDCGQPMWIRVERCCRLNEDECARRCTANPGGCDLYGDGLESDGLVTRVVGRRFDGEALELTMVGEEPRT